MKCFLFVASLGCALVACGSDDHGPGTPEPDASVAGSGAGGAGTGGGSGTGGNGGSSGAGARDAGTSGGSGPSGSDGGGMVPDTGPETGAGGTGLQGLPAYPSVPYPPENPHSDAKALLGKILFWEEQIGEDRTVACGTCHRSAAGGSDPRAATDAARLPGPDGVLDDVTTMTSDDTRGAQGIARCEEADGGIAFLPDAGSSVQITGRKPPTYLDAMFAADLFWDGRASRNFTDPDTLTEFLAGPAENGWIPGYGLESQAIGPPLSDVEMACVGQAWPDIHDVLRTATPLARATSIPQAITDFIAANGGSYPQMFAAAFGSAMRTGPGAPDDEINTARIAFAIATHERRLTSDQTPWDRWNAGDDAALTPDQVSGFELLMGKARCNSCHAPPLFLDSLFHFIGFHRPSSDPGREAITGDPVDRGRMKTPTLRNVGLREAGGLLHQGDGAGRDLDTVIGLYKLGGLVDDPEVATLPIDSLIQPLDLTAREIAQILDFLRNGLTDPRVRDEVAPFDRPKLGSEP